MDQGDGNVSEQVTLDVEMGRKLTETGERLLQALADVAMVALDRLARGPKTAPTDVLARGTNSMVGSSPAIARLVANHANDRENLRRLEREPFVARLVVRWEDEGREETLYVARASAAGLASDLRDVKLVTYASAVGRLAEFEVGEIVPVHIAGREREASIEERVTLRPARREGEWDALDDYFEFDTWTVALESIRRYLTEVGGPAALEEVPDLLGAILGDAQEASVVLERLRRGVIDHIGLRDQPILDRYQGEVFRMPLDRRLVLLGPPGTGKTTTLIRRLAQKRTPEALTEEEVETLRMAGLTETFVADPASWAMFSPTELLKLYLRDAFNREGVPAGPSNLRTWELERLSLGRNVLRILRTSEGRGFQLDESAHTLVDVTSDGVRRLYEEFAAAFEAHIMERSSDALAQIVTSEDPALVARVRAAVGRRRSGGTLSLREIAGLVDGAAELQSEVRRLADEANDETRRVGNRLVAAYPGLLDELVTAVPSLAGEDSRRDDEDDEEDEDEVEMSPVRGADDRQRAVQFLLTALKRRALVAFQRRGRVGGRSGRVLALLGDRIPSNEELVGLGTRLSTRARLRALMLAPRAYVMDAPRFYARFRQQSLRAGRLYTPEAAEVFRARCIAPSEVDVLILVMLGNARRLIEVSVRCSHIQ